jgi:hypothetical protein
MEQTEPMRNDATMCPICGAELRSPEAMEQHKRSVHPGEKTEQGRNREMPRDEGAGATPRRNTREPGSPRDNPSDPQGGEWSKQNRTPPGQNNPDRRPGEGKDNKGSPEKSNEWKDKGNPEKSNEWKDKGSSEGGRDRPDNKPRRDPDMPDDRQVGRSGGMDSEMNSGDDKQEMESEGGKEKMDSEGGNEMGGGKKRSGQDKREK